MEAAIVVWHEFSIPSELVWRADVTLTQPSLPKKDIRMQKLRNDTKGTLRQIAEG